MTAMTKGSVGIHFMAMLVGLALSSACALGGDAAEAEAEAEVSEVAAEVAAAAQSGNVVLDWATIAAEAITRPVEGGPAELSPATSTMRMAQVQLAVYDTLVALAGQYEPFSYTAKAKGSIHRDAAVATAAYRVLRTRLPGRAAYLDAQYAAALSAIANGKKKARGIALGESVAAHYLALRAHDNLDNTYVWVQPPPGPGVFEPVVPAQPREYRMLFAPPYTFSSAESPSFFPPPPPALTSAAYTAAWTEVRDLGRADSALRTEAQRQLVLWSAENAFPWTARNLHELAAANGLDRIESARFLALVYTSMADALQSGFTAKYHYNLWRPSLAINRGDTDGNPATAADPTWVPMLNANHPDYPSGHSFMSSGAMVEAVRAYFGTDAVSWTVTTLGVAGLVEPSRPYTTLTALADDIKETRVLSGLHFRFAADAGEAQGRAIAQHVTSYFFRPRP